MKSQGKKNELLKKLLQLFLIFLKVGLFSFGGGYTMVVFYEREFVEKHKWISSDEFSDLLAIVESTPGPIAINGATYIGYRIAGFLGSLVSTVATCIPSVVIIFLISLFFDEFLKFEVVQNAFKGIQAGVSLLILIAGIKMFKKMTKSKFNVIVFSIGATVMIVFAVLAVEFSSIYYILAGAASGLACYFAMLIKNKKNADKNNVIKETVLFADEKETESNKMESSDGTTFEEKSDNGENDKTSEIEREEKKFNGTEAVERRNDNGGNE